MTTKFTHQSKTNLLKRYPLVSFFILSYLFFLIAILFIGIFVSRTAVSDITIGLLIAFASWTPNLAAVVVSGVTEGREKIRRLFTGWFKWRVNFW